jgi:hypothetical protein
MLPIIIIIQKNLLLTHRLCVFCILFCTVNMSAITNLLTTLRIHYVTDYRKLKIIGTEDASNDTSYLMYTGLLFRSWNGETHIPTGKERRLKIYHAVVNPSIAGWKYIMQR